MLLILAWLSPLHVATANGWKDPLVDDKQNGRWVIKWQR